VTTRDSFLFCLLFDSFSSFFRPSLLPLLLLLSLSSLFHRIDEEAARELFL